MCFHCIGNFHTHTYTHYNTKQKQIFMFISVLSNLFCRALTVLTTTGFGDIVPQTTIEMAFSCFVMILGAIMYAGIVGNVMLVLNSLNAASMRHTEHIMKVANYMRYRKFPERLTNQVLQFSEAEW